MAFRAACLAAAILVTMTGAGVFEADLAPTAVGAGCASARIADADADAAACGFDETSAWSVAERPDAFASSRPPVLLAPMPAGATDPVRTGVRPVPYHPPALPVPGRR